MKIVLHVADNTAQDLHPDLKVLAIRNWAFGTELEGFPFQINELHKFPKLNADSKSAYVTQTHHPIQQTSQIVNKWAYIGIVLTLICKISSYMGWQSFRSSEFKC